MPCAHTDPPDVMTMAEGWLRERGVIPERWAGMKIRHGENTPGGPWSSVVIEIERRGSQWIVTQIDRRREPLPQDSVGLSIVK